MNFFQRFLRGGAPTTPEYLIYQKILGQSRNVDFYGEGRFADSYDGRLDSLTLHMAIVMDAARKLGGEDKQSSEKAAEFSQSLFDVMVKDFDTALREEGFTDAGVKRRIKPMIGRFYARLKEYTESLSDAGEIQKTAMSEKDGPKDVEFSQLLASYAMNFHEQLKNGKIDRIYAGSFDFPSI